MSKVPRYLITSADELLWKFDRPVIFLGEWCRRFDRKHIKYLKYGYGRATDQLNIAIIHRSIKTDEALDIDI